MYEEQERPGDALSNVLASTGKTTVTDSPLLAADPKPVTVSCYIRPLVPYVPFY